MKKSRGVVSEKEKLSKNIELLAKRCKNLNELEQKLKTINLKPYHRKRKLAGVWLNNRKYRLTTLGIDKKHLKEMTREQRRLNTLMHEQKSDDRSIEIEF